MEYTKVINNINHKPIFDIDSILNHFKEECLIYICTSDFCDFYFRATPHPEFGNKFVGIFPHEFEENKICIINGDKYMKDALFHTILDENGIRHYSSHRRDFVCLEDGRFIDGGRECPRTNTNGRVLRPSFRTGHLGVD